MVQRYVLEKQETVEEKKSPLTTCRNCNHIVPKTMLCLYCGSPILFKMPRIPEDGK